MENISRLTQINEQNALKAAEDAKHHEVVDVNLQTQQIILRSFSSLVDYLENKVTKTEVINQLENIGTPDVAHVVMALNDIHDTLETHQNTDLSGITSVMKEVLEEAQKLPKELPVIPEQQDYSKQFESLTNAIKAVEQVVKDQDLHVEAPVVNVPETQVNVDAPDLSPLEKHMKDITKAVKGIVIPEYKTDNKEVEKLLEKANKTLLKILERPMGGGGGGGGSIPFLNSSGEVSHVSLNPDGSLPTTAILKKKIDPVTTASVTYIGEAAVGTADATAGWRIQKIDETTSITSISWSGTGFNVKWSERATVVVYN